MKVIYTLIIFIFLSFFITTSAFSSVFDDQLLEIQKEWAKINYKISSIDKKKKAFEVLMKKTQAFVDENPGDAEPLIWDGIVNSTYAGVRGGTWCIKICKKSSQRF